MATDLYQDQFEKLKKRIDKPDSDAIEVQEGSSLPSRLEVHHKQKKKNKIKFSLIKVLLILFIMLPILTITMYNYFINKASFATTEGSDNEISYSIQNSQSDPEEDTNNWVPDEIPTDETKNDRLSSGNDEETNQSDSQDKKTVASDSDNDQDISKGEKEKEVTPVNSTTENQETNSQQQDNIIYHTVQEKETLFSIAMKYYHSQEGIEKIQQWNQINNNEILVGQVLQIHLDN